MKATLSTERLVLRDAVAEDVAGRLAAGPTSPEILRAYGHSGTATFGRFDAERWVSWLNAQPHAWVIVGGDRLLGSIRLDNVNHDDRRASLAVGLFNAADLGKGIGTEAAYAVLRLAFEDLKLHRVSVRVLEFNVRAIRLYERLGFRLEGKERETAFVDGKWCDDLIMGVLAHEFAALPPLKKAVEIIASDKVSE